MRPKPSRYVYLTGSSLLVPGLITYYFRYYTLLLVCCVVAALVACVYEYVSEMYREMMLDYKGWWEARSKWPVRRS